MTGTFDVVVAGGGASGCVMAARLAETPSRSVLLLEAGPDLRGATPPAFRDGWGIALEERGWGYVSEMRPGGGTQNVWRTKALGGTSWMTRFALRGAPADYDGWGCAGWGFDEVLPYLTRLESDLEFGADAWHGTDGPMPVTRYPERDYSDAAAAQIEAIEELGFPRVDDHNRPGAVGLGRMPMSTRDGLRVTTLDAYLTEEGSPANLTIRCGVQVDAVVFDGDRAAGVRLADGTVIAAGHVVLSAGVYGSPPILLRSGIGPADQLQSLGIALRADLPGVGQNLADHPVMDVCVGEPEGRPRPDPLHFIATFHSSGTPATEAPDLMLWGADPEENAFELEAVLMRPRSRGHVRLRSADPTEPPVITLPALTDPADVERMAEVFALAAEVAGRCGYDVPAPRDVEEIRRTARSLPHVVGTCALGEVVDSAGHVLVCEGLTVADASVIPEAPSGFTHFPAIMVAERLSAAL